MLSSFCFCVCFRVISNMPKVEKSSMTQEECEEMAVREYDNCNWEDAIYYYTQALNLTKKNNIQALALYYRNRGGSYFNLGEYQKALKDYEMILKVDPERNTDPRVLLRIGEALEALGRFRKAYEVGKKALLLDPNNIRIQCLMVTLENNILKHEVSSY